MKKVIALLAMAMISQAASAQQSQGWEITKGTFNMALADEKGAVIIVDGDLAKKMYTSMDVEPTSIDENRHVKASGHEFLCNEDRSNGTETYGCMGVTKDVTSMLDHDVQITLLSLDDKAMGTLKGQDALDLFDAMTTIPDQDGLKEGKNFVCFKPDEASNIDDNTCFFGIELKAGGFMVDKAKTMYRTARSLK